jgi:catechol 2,3-dioxygenase-like lactoylglutathione lyase family enzyme
LLAAPAEDASFLVEVRRPLGAVDAGEAHVRVQRSAHRVDEPVCPLRLESLLPPEPEHRGAELVGELERYEDSYRLCYVRGPEGIIIELAEQIG